MNLIELDIEHALDEYTLSLESVEQVGAVETIDVLA